MFDSVVVLLIFTSIATFSFETLPNLPPTVTSGLELVEVVMVVLFTIEYGLRVALADDRWRFVQSFSGRLLWRGRSCWYFSASPRC